MTHTENTITYETVDAKEFAERIKDSKVYLLDVRTPEEYAKGHLDGAINLDILNPDFVEEAEKMLPADKTIAVYCGTGKRSAMASEQLAEIGLRVLNLDGGLEAWNKMNS